MAVVATEVLPRFRVRLAKGAADVVAAQQLRYRIFANELGAAIDGGHEGRDCDVFDAHCEHLLVHAEDGRLVACTRLLTDAGARAAGEFYSAHEFDMTAIDRLDGRKLEVGRTCVDAEFRNGTTIATLWSGLADYVAEQGIDYLFGCASVPLDDPGEAQRILDLLADRYPSAPDLRVRSRQPLPRPPVSHSDDDDKPRLPPLLKAYVSLGARACGEAFWDTDFRCADVFMLLNIRELHPRYARHFLGPQLAGRRR